MTATLKDLAAELKLEHVAFPGFINQSELPRIYAASDVFVLASENEPWGLIVNEVMCAGLPVVVGDQVGCAADLVENGGNGWLVPAGQLQYLAERLLAILETPEQRRAMGQRSIEIIAGWGYEQCVRHSCSHRRLGRLINGTEPFR
jgi:glycosyltransferase involved in cell wall biosynthesis